MLPTFLFSIPICELRYEMFRMRRDSLLQEVSSERPLTKQDEEDIKGVAGVLYGGWYPLKPHTSQVLSCPFTAAVDTVVVSVVVAFPTKLNASI